MAFRRQANKQHNLRQPGETLNRRFGSFRGDGANICHPFSLFLTFGERGCGCGAARQVAGRFAGKVYADLLGWFKGADK